MPRRASFDTSRAHGSFTVGSASMASSSSAACSMSPAYQWARPRSARTSEVCSPSVSRMTSGKSRRVRAMRAPSVRMPGSWGAAWIALLTDSAASSKSPAR